MKIKYFLTFTLFFSILFFKDFGGVSIAQNRNIDSLLALIETDRLDTNKVNHLNKLSREYLSISDHNNGVQYGMKALALASSVVIENKRGWTKGIVSAYNSIALIYWDKGNYHQTLTNYYSVLKIKNKLNDRPGIANTYHIIGIVYSEQGKYNEALKSYFFALNIRKEIADYKGIAQTYNNIGVTFTSLGNFHEALKHHMASLKIKKLIDDKKGISGSYNNIGLINWNQGNLAEALKNYFAYLNVQIEIGNQQGVAIAYNNIGSVYESQGNYSEALKHYFLALKIREKIANNKQEVAESYNNIGGIYHSQKNFPFALKSHLHALKFREDIGDKQGISMSYNNIGLVYQSEGKNLEAFHNFNTALKIKKEIGDKKGMAQIFFHLGVLNTKLNKMKEAEKYLNDGLALSIQIGSKEWIKKSYNGLSLLDSIQGNWKAAYQHHKLFIIFRDSIDNAETKKKTTEIILTDKFEKQEAATKAEQDKKDTITAANKKRQELILILVSFVLILVFIFAGFVVRSLRITRKQKRIIELQKNEVSHQKEIVSEKNKEITDSINYAQRIQRALLASDKLLDSNLIRSYSGLVSESQQMLKDIQHDRDYFIFFQPKDIVSGDFYWASPLANGNFALVTADSTGHGVPGAIMSMLNISCLNEAVKGQQLTEPSEILNYTRSKIIEHLSNDGSAEGGKDGMDCSLISFDFNTNSSIGEDHEGRLTYSAANNPIWIVRKKQIIELEPDKMPVGKHTQDSIPFTQHTVKLEKCDIVYAITDGMPDQFGGPKGKKFMSKQLKELLINISHLPMKVQKERLSDEFSLWKGNLEQVDDVTVIGIRV
ncbi:MAG: tetratricopeptide repeat protein [Bacteroidota bacterium]